MRSGHNPKKNGRADVRLENVVLTCVTHLPNQEGYHAGRLEVIQTCLRTMRAGAHVKHSLAVWDNGSCAELRDWLMFDFKPDILILSANIGKTSARSALTRMLHPNTIVGYADDDILFYDNWLTPQIELLEHFPNVACVTGYPVRTSFRWGNENTLKWAQANGTLETGRFIPQEWEDDFARSLGREVGWHRTYTKDDTDQRVTYQGKQAYCTSHHCQFIARVKTIDRILQYDNSAMGDERPFDLALDSVGLRLATTQRWTRHIGNVLDESIRSELWQPLALQH